MKYLKIISIILFGMILVGLSSCGSSKKDDHNPATHVESTHSEDNGHDKVENESINDAPEVATHESEVVLAQAAVDMIGLTIETAQHHILYKEIVLPGETKANEDSLQHIYPRFAGCVCGIYASIGDVVSKGQLLANIQNNETLTNYNITSSLNGTVIAKHVTIGEIVKEDEQIFTIVNLNDVWVEFDVYTKDMEYIKKGQEIDIKAVGLSRETTGTISYVSPVLNSDKRSLTARVVLSNANGVWAPGMFVKGSVHIPTLIDGIAVPNEAIQIVNEKKAVFIPVPNEENTFIPVPVTTGESDDNYTIITSGITLHDPLVTRGAFELKAKLVTSSLGGHAGHNH